MSGNGASGTLCSVLGLVTAGAVEDSDFAFEVFFGLCAVQIVLCILAWFYMRTLAEAASLGRTFSATTWSRLCCPVKQLQEQVEMAPHSELQLRDLDLEEQPEAEDAGQEPVPCVLELKTDAHEMEAIFSPRSLNQTELQVLDHKDAEMVPMPRPTDKQCC